MFRNRYGVDKLSFALVFIAIILSIISLFFGYSLYIARYIIHAVTFALIIIAFLRAFSRNFSARERELHAYLDLEYKVMSVIRRITGSTANRRYYKYFHCPKCHQKLRVPRGKGKVRVRCAKCSHQFERRV